MLCSHDKKFIYFKTRKTAGTSVEIFFERFCVPPGEYAEMLTAHEKITPFGIVGSRAAERSYIQRNRAANFYNHMPAAEIREKLGPEIFDSYFKFCVIRNPFDKVVSQFWWTLHKKHRERTILGYLPFYFVRKRFAKFVKRRSASGRLTDHHVFMVDGKPVADEFIKFEELASGIASVCRKLGIDADVGGLGNYKATTRIRKEHFSDYYDRGIAEIIERDFEWELRKFGYKLS